MYNLWCTYYVGSGHTWLLGVVCVHCIVCSATLSRGRQLQMLTLSWWDCNIIPQLCVMHSEVCTHNHVHTSQIWSGNQYCMTVRNSTSVLEPAHLKKLTNTPIYEYWFVSHNKHSHPCQLVISTIHFSRLYSYIVIVYILLWEAKQPINVIDYSL